MSKKSKANLIANLERIQEEADEGVSQQLTNEEVLKKRIPWEGLQKASLISAESLELLKDYDKQTPEGQQQLLDQEGESYAELLLKVLSKLVTAEVTQYLLCWIDEILKDEERIPLFLGVKDVKGKSEDDKADFPFRPFLSLLISAGSNTDWYIKSRSSKILATLLVAAPKVHSNEASSLLRWTFSQIKNSKDDVDELLIAISALQILLRRDDFRLMFVQDDGLKTLANVARDNSDKQQLLYQVLFVFWVISFNEEIASDFSDENGLVSDIVEMLRKKSKLKIRRIAIATLHNLLGKGKNNQHMIEAGIIRVLGYLNQKKWGDDDIENDLEVLTEALQKDVIEMTSWEIYKKEVTSGNLSWTPVHKTDKFWRENITRFEENKFETLGILLGLIRASKNPVVLSVALYDIGEFVRFHPRGRRIIAGLEGKADIMSMMTHGNEEVQKHALLCVQKMMVHNWEYLSRNI
jgi:V-type H+-transporting ATPase subunit H